MNTAIISPTPANSGLGFAIPSEEARFVFERMAQEVDGERLAWLGAKLQAVTPEMAEAMGQPQLRGSIVSWVLPDQPAQKAGIIVGDVILRFDGKTFPDERALRRAITVRKPGEQVAFSLWHNGQEIEMKVTLEPWPKSIWERSAALPPNLHVTVPPDLGLTVAQLTDALRASNEITADTKGVLVTEVEPGSDAEQQGVTVGDLVLQAGPNHVRSPEEFWSEVDRVRSEGRRFGLFLLLSKIQPVAVNQFPGAKWIALRIAAD